MVQDIVRKIKKTRKKLNISIEKNGIDSEQTEKLSKEMNDLINQYYEMKKVYYPSNSTMKENYERSYKELKQLTKRLNKFPTVEKWNNYAKENNYLSNVSLEYISEIKWNYLRAKILSELNMGI